MNRRIASINRIDELNHRTAFQNDPKRPVDSLMGRQDRPERAQEQPKTPSRRPKSPPRPSKEGQEAPRAAQDPPMTTPRPPKTTQDPPKSPLKTVLGPSWDHQTTRSKTRRFRLNSDKLLGSILEPKMLPKTTPKRVQNESKSRRKMHHFFIAF